jgi:hypothetical protein
LGVPSYYMIHQGLFERQFVNIAPTDDADDMNDINPSIRRPNHVYQPELLRSPNPEQCCLVQLCSQLSEIAPTNR